MVNQNANFYTNILNLFTEKLTLHSIIDYRKEFKASEISKIVGLETSNNLKNLIKPICLCHI